MQAEIHIPKAETVQDICMMAPTEQLAEKARKIIQERGDHTDVVVCGQDHDGIVMMAATLLKKGVKVIISRKGTKQIIEENLDTKVVDLNNTLTDYIKTILENQTAADKSTDLVAFFSYGPLSDEVMRMCRTLHIRAKNYTFYKLDDCRTCIAQAMDDGAAFGIGGAWSDIIAREVGFPHVILENSSESIVNALESANQIRAIQKEEYIKQQRLRTQLEMYQAVLNFTHDAIMSVDENGDIQVVNPVAERIIGKTAASLIGKPISRVLANTRLPDVMHSGAQEINQIMQINKTLTNTNRVPIIVDNEVRGVVATFQDVKQLQSSEQKIRLKLHEKGLVAKYTFSDIQGESSAIENTIRIARGYAASDAAVLIHGETGVGKELFAQSIHNASKRRNGPFVALNCAAVSNNLLESELFGYEEGAFTGASRGGREGLFELAHGGTIFLDEIGEISIETQVELLRVLQEKEIRRVGGSRVIPVDVRVITATNKDLIQQILDKEFREDLYYRLNVLDLDVPPLRDRDRDVEILGLSFFRKFSGSDDPDLQQKFLGLLAQVQDYAWYGNIRELQNFAERVVIMMRSDTDQFSVMTEMMRRRSQAPMELPKDPGTAEAHERQRVLAALQSHPNSLESAASSLGISRQTLWRKMKKYGLSR